MRQVKLTDLDNYDRFALNLPCEDCPGKSSVDCCENRNIGDLSVPCEDCDTPCEECPSKENNNDG